MLKIGEKTFKTRRPADLDEQLIAATGCNAAEVARLVAGKPLAGLVAQAVRPFLSEEDRQAVPALAVEISSAGIVEIAGEVLKLYADLPAPTPTTPAGGETGGKVNA